MAEKKMTNREFYTGVIALENTEGVPAEIVEKAQELLEKLNAANEKRKSAPKKPSKAKEENAPIAEAITAYLAEIDGTALAKDIATAIGQTVQKTTAVLRQMKDDGTVERVEPDNRNKPIEYKAV